MNEPTNAPKQPKTESNELNTNLDNKTPKSEDLSRPVPQKPEDKPFDVFINDEFIPRIKKALDACGRKLAFIELRQGERPVVGGNCWMVIGKIDSGRQFWLCFNKDSISSDKTIALAESESQPSTLESFLIDERKTTLALLVSRLLQRLNGQKWLGSN